MEMIIKYIIKGEARVYDVKIEKPTHVMFTCRKILLCTISNKIKRCIESIKKVKTKFFSFFSKNLTFF